MQARPFRNPANYAAFLFPLVAAFANKLLPVVMIVMLAAYAFAARPWRLRFWTPLLALFGLLLAWSLLSAAWSIDPGESLKRFGRLAPTIGGGLLLCGLVLSMPPDRRREAAGWLAAGFLLTGGLVLLRQAWLWLAPDDVPHVIYWMPVLPYSAIAVMCMFPLLAALDSRPLLMLAAVAAVVSTTVVAGSSASAVALAAGAVVYAAVYWLGRRAVQVLAVAIPVLFLALPLALEPLALPSRLAAQGWTVNNSTAHRLVIWRYVGGKIREAPILGHGLYAGRFLPDREASGRNDPRYADIVAIAPALSDARFELMPNHPHNASLQLTLDLGVVGAVLYAALFGLCLLALLRAPLPPGVLAAGAGLAAAIFVIGQLSFSAWQSWWLSAQFIAGALYLALAWPAAPPQPD